MNISMWTSLSGSAPNPLWLRLTSDDHSPWRDSFYISTTYWLDKTYTRLGFAASHSRWNLFTKCFLVSCLPLELGNISRREHSSFTVVFMFYSHWTSHQKFRNRHNSTCKRCKECELLSWANLFRVMENESNEWSVTRSVKICKLHLISISSLLFGMDCVCANSKPSLCHKQFIRSVHL